MSDDPVAQAERALQQGDTLLAYDIAAEAVAAGDPAPRLRYQMVLALARMGDTDSALDQLDGQSAVDEDQAALRGRLLKDRALAAPPAERAAAFAAACAAYEAAHARFGGYFAGINAATLALLAGDRPRSQALARALRDSSALAQPNDYFEHASAAEAALLLGDPTQAARLIRAAIRLPDANPGARASTARQIRMLAPALSIDADVTDMLQHLLRPPPVLVYSGHMFGGNQPAEAALRARIDAAIASAGASIAYGALACGADLLIAEALLAAGAELNIVLPFATTDFVLQSVDTGGACWRARFDAVIGRAASVSHATSAGAVGDPGQYHHGTAYMFGLARLRARALETRVALIAVWDGSSGVGPAGTQQDIALAERLGIAVDVIPLGPLDRARGQAATMDVPAIPRETRSIIFTDYSGFSKLAEAALPRFWEEVMGRIGRVLDGHAPHVRFRNSWGDALYAVVDTPVHAAEIALSIQEALAGFDPQRLGLPDTAGTRIGVHHGPVFVAPDPITGRQGYFGTEVTRAARIEPITPVGKVYATQPFAAILALEPVARFATNYVGRVPLAKAYGTIRMHRLTRVTG
ncbi:adenylate/guanylate cyclase domain-containing protein [Sphingomonas sp. 1P06PA]|uniref:tetratricopeptide repeat-containing protein n=1 Tax=Sphingomonas sp. 1P06PA TaxID=554121 RepID=UPI0039A63003